MVKRFKMKYNIVIAILVLFSLKLSAQNENDTTDWNSGTSGTVTFSQVSLNNWAAGGENSFSADGQFDFFATYDNDKISWENTLDLAYGLVKFQ